MRKNLFMCLLIILIILTGTAVWIVQHRSSPGTGRVGDLFLKELALPEIASITIQSANNQVILSKKEGQWVVENRYDYQADFTKISNFVEKLKAARIGREFPIREDIQKRLKLNLPTYKDLDNAEKGTRVFIKDKAGALLVDILFGTARQLDDAGIPDSQYMMLDAFQSVYLVDLSFASLEKIPQAWMALPVIEAQAKEVKKIECFKSGEDIPTYVFARTEKGKELLPAKQSGKNLPDQAIIKKLQWAITYLPLEDVLPPLNDPGTIGLTESIRLDYYLFNGMIYRVFPCGPCSDKKPCYIKIEVDYQKPETKPTGFKENFSDSSEEKMIKAKELNIRLGNWIYKISKGYHTSLFCFEPDVNY